MYEKNRHLGGINIGWTLLHVLTAELSVIIIVFLVQLNTVRIVSILT